jgi:uncharacterized membrane protein
MAIDAGSTIMAKAKADIDTYAASTLPNIRRISHGDVKDALARGWDDFKAMPTFAVFLVVIYPVIGFILFNLTFGYNLLPLAFPLLAGFALVGPVAAIGLYEMSRRRELGLDISLNALNILKRPAMGSIIALGAVLLAIFFIWLSSAQSIYNSIFGNPAQPPSFAEFTRQVFTTPAGLKLIAVGCGVGFLFALATFTISVISFPLLLDRNVGLSTAVLTSIKAVAVNPATMGLWGLIVTIVLIFGILPGLTGLIVALPVLGHSTWHLYRKVVGE